MAAWPHRLSVRTRAFQACKPGSTPGEVTKNPAHNERDFYLCSQKQQLKSMCVHLLLRKHYFARMLVLGMRYKQRHEHERQLNMCAFI